jgi:hydroxymethylbilane synthase
MARSLTIATRGGALALAQTQIVITALQERWPNLDCQLNVITTHGDQDQRTALWDLRGALWAEGFFTSQLEQALLAGEADVAVHSFKDLPTRQVPGLQIGAVCDRQYPEDCLVAASGIKALTDLPKAARIGTSSLRRAAQVRQSRPDLQVLSIRGNVETRLSKLDAGQVEAVIMARAGLERLGLAARIKAVLDPHQFIPAAAQGALAVQVRAEDRDTVGLLTVIDQPQTRRLVEAERQVLISTGCGCHAPVGAFAEMEGNKVHLHAFMADPDGRRLVRRKLSGPPEKAQALAQRIAADLAKAVGG